LILLPAFPISNFSKTPRQKRRTPFFDFLKTRRFSKFSKKRGGNERFRFSPPSKRAKTLENAARRK
jgi:hypothetical protein